MALIALYCYIYTTHGYKYQVFWGVPHSTERSVFAAKIITNSKINSVSCFGYYRVLEDCLSAASWYPQIKVNVLCFVLKFLWWILIIIYNSLSIFPHNFSSFYATKYFLTANENKVLFFSGSICKNGILSPASFLAKNAKRYCLEKSLEIIMRNIFQSNNTVKYGFSLFVCFTQKRLQIIFT